MELMCRVAFQQQTCFWKIIIFSVNLLLFLLLKITLLCVFCSDFFRTRVDGSSQIELRRGSRLGQFSEQCVDLIQRRRGASIPRKLPSCSRHEWQCPQWGHPDDEFGRSCLIAWAFLCRGSQQRKKWQFKLLEELFQSDFWLSVFRWHSVSRLPKVSWYGWRAIVSRSDFAELGRHFVSQCLGVSWPDRLASFEAI